MEPAGERPDDQKWGGYVRNADPPQWSRPVNGRTTGADADYAGTLAAPQWSRPVNGRTTVAAAGFLQLDDRAAMEPAGERPDDWG